MSILTAAGVSKRFGGLAAVSDLSFTLEEGEILAIIGPNGAGKTTLLNMVSGLLIPDAGTITLDGQDITRESPEVRCHLGLGRAFQVVQPFPEMTVEENVRVGALFGTPGTDEGTARAVTEDALKTTGLWHLRHTPAEDLTLMQEKRLEIARALGTQPRVILLDEVMAGLRPREAAEAIELVKRVRAGGVTVVFIEHIMPVVKDLADRVIVMDYGRVLAEGLYGDVMGLPAVIEAYLGPDDDADDPLPNQEGEQP